MAFFDWLKRLVSGPELPPLSEPTDEEWAEANAALAASLRPAVFGALGEAAEVNPEKPTSHWGGGFFAKPGESPPVCAESALEMQPLVQVRIDELPVCPPALEGFALVNIWFDPKSGYLWEGNSGTGFAVRCYESLDDLVPIETAGKAHLRAFPLSWTQPVQIAPDWEEFPGKIPESVEDHIEYWYFESEYANRAHELLESHTVMVGGWPQVIQWPNTPEGSDFALQVMSTRKGKWEFGDGGHLYFYRTGDDWEIRGDCS